MDKPTEDQHAPRRAARIGRAARPVLGALRRVGRPASAGRSPAARVPLADRVRRALTGAVARDAGWAAAVIAVAVVGVVVGVLLGGRTQSDIGPFSAQLRVTPSLVGDSEVRIPPLGALHLDSHDGPAHLSVTFDQLDQQRTQQLFADPHGIARASESAVQDVTVGGIKLALRTLAVAVLATLLLAALVFRDSRRVAWAGVFSLAITATSLASAVGTFRVNAIEEPRYEGLLVNAPAVVGDARRIADQYDQYAAQLQKLVTNVGQIYTTMSTLPVFDGEIGTTRVLHVSDLHLNPTAWSMIDTVVQQFAIDVVIDTGDINDWGSELEASYVDPIGRLGVPYVYIQGNHDSALTAQTVGRQRNAVVLDDSVTTVAGLTIAGIADPRFTPDKQSNPTGSGSSKQTAERVLDTGTQLAATIARSKRPVDIALVHDPASAAGLAGSAPLVLAGHTHKRKVQMMRTPEGVPPTRLMVCGSTGGAGLRGLEGQEPLPLSMSVLYFDAERHLKAYDDIEVGGTGQAQVTLERHVVAETVAAPGAAAHGVTPTSTSGATSRPAATPSR